jgi:mono/diheme cytochrome c family protein
MRNGTIDTPRNIGAHCIAAALLLAMPQALADNGGASMSGPSTFSQTDGAALYQAICQGCHMPDAQGAAGAGAYPALAHNQKLAAALYPVYTVLKGRNSMPPLGSYLSDAQVVAVVTYLRTHFGNHFTDPITAEAVKNARASE